MRFLIGLACLAAAGGFVAAGLLHRRRALVAIRRSSEGAAEGSLTAFGQIARPLILGVLAYVGLKAVLIYAAFDGGRVLSPLDLAGFLALLAGYGFWLSLRVKHRLLPETQAVPLRGSHADDGRLARADRGLADRPGRVRLGRVSAVVGPALDEAGREASSARR
ncbi:MAG TPA: hypothetical protein VIL65_10680 [Beijerinckiaceae bacterium]|jgi:hypothetical protein